VIFLEPKRLYWSKEDCELGGRSTPIGTATIVRTGSDCTLVTYGSMRQLVELAAEEAQIDGVSCEVVDLRSLAPLDGETVMSSIRKTRRAVIVAEAPVSGSFAAELAARITVECFASLEAPVIRVGGYDVPYPPAKLEHRYLPDIDRVMRAIDSVVNY
jgi:pyruvate dehydrogenase E1 component beta subunit